MNTTANDQVKPQSYAHAKGARAAARKVLGAEAAESKEFELVVGDDGRFSWTPIAKDQAEVKGIDHGNIDWDKVPVAVDVVPPAAPALVEAAALLDAKIDAQPDHPAPSRAASAFGAFAMGQLGAGNNSTTAAKAPKAPVEKKVKTPPEIVNGVRKPSVGTVCRAVWDELEKLRTENGGTPPDSKQVKALAEAMSWNPNNASIEFYQWRKFNGITGRAAKAA